MTTKKKVRKIPRSRVQGPKSVVLPQMDPDDVAMKKARRLPLFGPGIVIPVPERLYPAYLQLYDLVPMTLLEVSAVEQKLGRRKPDGLVWVKRVPRATKPEAGQA